jgi:hypothetical protein
MLRAFSTGRALVCICSAELLPSCSNGSFLECSPPAAEAPGSIPGQEMSVPCTYVGRKNMKKLLLPGGNSMSAGGAADWSSCEPPAVNLAYLEEPPSLRVGQLTGAAVSPGCDSSLPGGTSMSAGGAAGWSSCEPPAVSL